jgi:soluble lytic murein transglycosylase-like protein
VRRGLLRAIALGCALLVPPGPVTSSPLSPLDSALRRLRRISRGEGVAVSPPRPAVTGAAPARSSATRRLPFADEIRRAARRHGVPATLLAALVRVESNFDPRAVSHKGARGLGQLMPGTARELGVHDAFDPAANLDGSARYLARQLGRFGSAHRALAAYNAGPERVAGGYAFLPRETYSYVSRVLSTDLEYRRRGLP